MYSFLGEETISYMRKFDYNQTPRTIAETLRGRKSKTHSSMRKIFERPCSSGAAAGMYPSTTVTRPTFTWYMLPKSNSNLTRQILCTVKCVARSEDNHDFSFWNFMCGDGFNFGGIAHMNVRSSCFLKNVSKV